jgi:zinc transport system permease protein
MITTYTAMSLTHAMATIMLDLLLFPLIAGALFSALCGPFGSFVVWKRSAFFGETIAHGGLGGLALGYLMGVAPSLTIILAALIIAVILTLTFGLKKLPSDTLLAIISHGGLAIGLLVVSLIENKRPNISTILLGDILSVDIYATLTLLATFCLAALMLWRNWQSLMLLTIDTDLAKAEGHKVRQTQLLFYLTLALVIAVSVQMIGVLLITALMIIPAASSRLWTQSPEAMAVVASAIALISIYSGFYLSYLLDTPVGASAVVTALICFLLSALTHNRLRL